MRTLTLKDKFALVKGGKTPEEVERLRQPDLNVTYYHIMHTIENAAFFNRPPKIAYSLWLIDCTDSEVEEAAEMLRSRRYTVELKEKGNREQYDKSSCGLNKNTKYECVIVSWKKGA